ncbi:MAG TPA: hypothetical protein DCG12_20175 [Planctomycetaceae bacterium]|nr:hypothetical protein [Planctomycetaceae bacterium]
MRSSTSSSDPAATSTFSRDLPASTEWSRIVLVTVLLAVSAVGFREWSLKENGIVPSLSTQAPLWAWQRNLVRAAPSDSTVVVGSSRIAWGFDLEEWAKCSGEPRPYMLAWPAICPRPQLHDLANQQDFRGTLLVGVAPGFFFGGPDYTLAMRVRDFIKLSEHWGPADDIEQRLRFLIEPVFAFMSTGEASPLLLLRERIDLPQREGQLAPLRDRLFFRTDKHCRGRLIEGVENRPRDIEAFTSILVALKARSRLYPPGNVDLILEEVVKDVREIHNRGGQVIFVRYPSTGWYREDEQKHQPREKYWDRLIEETGCLGIHFEDHRELSGFAPPENSHLTQQDAITFTRRLHNVIEKEQSSRHFDSPE